MLFQLLGVGPLLANTSYTVSLHISTDPQSLMHRELLAESRQQSLSARSAGAGPVPSHGHQQCLSGLLFSDTVASRRRGRPSIWQIQDPLGQSRVRTLSLAHAIASIECI